MSPLCVAAAWFTSAIAFGLAVEAGTTLPIALTFCVWMPLISFSVLAALISFNACCSVWCTWLTASCFSSFVASGLLLIVKIWSATFWTTAFLAASLVRACTFIASMAAIPLFLAVVTSSVVFAWLILLLALNCWCATSFKANCFSSWVASVVLSIAWFLSVAFWLISFVAPCFAFSNASSWALTGWFWLGATLLPFWSSPTSRLLRFLGVWLFSTVATGLLCLFNPSFDSMGDSLSCFSFGVSWACSWLDCGWACSWLPSFTGLSITALGWLASLLASVASGLAICSLFVSTAFLLSFCCWFCSWATAFWGDVCSFAGLSFPAWFSFGNVWSLGCPWLTTLSVNGPLTLTLSCSAASALLGLTPKNATVAINAEKIPTLNLRILNFCCLNKFIMTILLGVSIVMLSIRNLFL